MALYSPTHREACKYFIVIQVSNVLQRI